MMQDLQTRDDIDIFEPIEPKPNTELFEIAKIIKDLEERLDLNPSENLAENIDRAIKSLALEELNKRQNFLRIRKNPELPNKSSYILEKDLPIKDTPLDIFDVATLFAKQQSVPVLGETPAVGLRVQKKFQEGGEVSPDLGTIEPLSPLEEQRIFNPTLYQRAINYLTTQGFTPEQEQARQLARGIASVLPGLSTDIAIAERDRLGQGLSLLDLIPVAGPIAKTATKKGIEGVQAIVETPKKVKSSDKITDLKAQGFNVDEPVYHGTFADFDKFDEKFIGNRDEGFFGRGFYFAKEPGEARYYGPIVKKYFTRGKFLDLSQNKTNSDFELLDKKYFKFWAKELDKIDMLDEPTKKGLKTINKIDDYVDKNLKFIQSSDNRGNEGISAYIKHPTKGEDTLNHIYSGFGLADKATAVKSLKDEIIRSTRFDSELRKLFPDTENILYSLSDYIRVGGKGAAEFTEKAKKFGYDGIKVGDETLVFDSKNIASADTTVDVAKKNIKFPKGAEE